MALLEIREPGRSGRDVVLDGDRVAVGKADGNDVVLVGDPAVSRVHLLLEPVGAAWRVTDVGSRNGTLLNESPLLGSRVLRPGDALRVGRTTMVFRREGSGPDASVTRPMVAAPDLTERDRAMLAALCRPVVEGSMLSEPASVRVMAAELFVTESAVKKGLARLYDKFGLYDDDRRRGALAAAAIERGVAAGAPRR